MPHLLHNNKNNRVITMRKLFILIGLMITVEIAMAKTTYIPKYTSYIHIVNGNDTIVVADSVSEIELAERSGLFSIRVEHEEVNKEKVKAIKRAKRAVGWMSFSAAMSSVSTSLSSNNLQYYVRSQNTNVAFHLLDLYNNNAIKEQKLNTDVWIDNTSDKEIMINDTERGLMWYVKPRQTLHITPNNPDVQSLRISDINNQNVNYAVIATGNYTLKWEVEWEDSNSWIVSIYKDSYNEYAYDKLDRYRRINKATFVEEDMTIDEYKSFIAEEKRKKKMKK